MTAHPPQDTSLFRVLLDALPHGLVLTNEDEGTATVNPAAAELLECEAGVMAAEQFSKAMQHLHRRLSGSSQVRVEGRDLVFATEITRINVVWDIVRPTRRIVLVSTLAVQSPAVRGRLWTFQDVSSLLDAEAEQARLLRQLERERGRLDELLTHAPAMILLVRGPEHVVEYANDAVFQVTGGRQIVGQRLFDDANPGMLGSDVHAAYNAAFHTGTPWNGTAVRVAVARSARPRPANDSGVGEYFYNISLQPLRDADGQTSGLFVHSVDVTEQVKAVEQLRQSQRLETMGRLAGGVAHDFNNLLTVISGSTDLLLAELPPNSRAYATATDVHNAARRAASLTRQLLTFGRRHTLQQHVVCLDELVRGIERLVRQLTGERIAVNFELQAGEATLMADPSHLEQVLLNLAANARDAMPEGGSLSIRTQVTMAAPGNLQHSDPQLRGPHLRIEVQDSGEGMDPQTIAQAFEPFFTTKSPDKGTGLGLSTVRAIVQETGGQVWVESERNLGTTVVITLPLTGEPVTQIADAPSATSRTRTTGSTGSTGSTGITRSTRNTRSTLLLVEDDSVTSMVAQRILVNAGYQVLVAKSGAEGMRLWQNHLAQQAESSLPSDGPVALVIADLAMPGLNGRDMVRQMRMLVPTLPVLFTSGDARAMLEAEDLRGPTMFLPKPFTAELLLREVATLLPGG